MCINRHVEMIIGRNFTVEFIPYLFEIYIEHTYDDVRPRLGKTDSYTGSWTHDMFVWYVYIIYEWDCGLLFTGDTVTIRHPRPDSVISEKSTSSSRPPSLEFGSKRSSREIPLSPTGYEQPPTPDFPPPSPMTAILGIQEQINPTVGTKYHLFIIY